MPTASPANPIPVTVTLRRGEMFVRPCAPGLKDHLTTTKPYKSGKRFLRLPQRQWSQLEDEDGIVCSRGFYRKVCRFLEKNGIPFTVREEYRLVAPKVTRRVLRTVSESHFHALKALMDNLDCAGGVILHPEDEDISGLIRGLIRLFPKKRFVVCAPDLKTKTTLTDTVNRYMHSPEEELKTLGGNGIGFGLVPELAVIHEAELLLPDPDEVDVFVMVNADRVSGLQKQEDVSRYDNSLKFGFATKTRNARENKLPKMEELFGPVACDLRKIPQDS